MSGVIIRKADRSDLAGIIELAAESMVYSRSIYRDTSLEGAKRYRIKDLQHLYLLYGQPGFEVFVAVENGNLIGHVLVFIGSSESVSGEEQGWIIDLSVVPSHWGKGIARELHKKAENFVKQKGLNYIGLAVTSTNERAVQFYERLGYKEERKKMIKVIGRGS